MLTTLTGKNPFPASKKTIRTPRLAIGVLAGLAGWLLAAGCSSYEKTLRPGQHLLYSQRIRGTQKVAAAELEPFYVQKANRRFLNLPVFPYLGLYRAGLRTYSRPRVEKEIAEVRARYERKTDRAGNDSGRVARLQKKRDRRLKRLNRQLLEGNGLMRAGEPPVVFDSLLARRTAGQMQEYLRSKGYFGGTVAVRWRLDTSQRAYVAYSVAEGERTLMRRTTWQTDNPSVDSLLAGHAARSLLRPGDGYDAERMARERDRIDKLLKDNGYYNFSRQYITFAVNDTLARPATADTAVADTAARSPARPQVDVAMLINNPPDGTAHRIYRVDAVRVTEDAGTRGPARRDTALFQGVQYLARRHRFSYKVLNTKVMIRPGSRYSQQKSIDTQRLLGSLDMFKFANIFYDTTGGRFTANVYTSPLDKYAYSVEGGGTVTLANGYPGPFGSANFKVRNVFGGLEIFELRGTGGIEGVAGFGTEVGSRGILSSQQLSLTSSLLFPQMLLPGRIKYFFSPYAPQTRIQVGYNFTGRPDFRRFGFRGTLSYGWQPEPEKQYTVTLLEINRIFSEYTRNAPGDSLRQEIERLKARGSTLWRAFQKAFVSSLSASYTYNGNLTSQRRRSRFLRLYAETGGSFLNLPGLERLGIRAGDYTADSLQFYRFYKCNADYRYYLPRGRRGMWAFRINLGFANPYGPAGTLPYEKFFFAGGSNSVRAWLPRRLGLGSSKDTLNAKGFYEYRFEQPGDILLEASAEYRTRFLRLGSFNVDVAFFTDAGNVWVLRPDATIPDGHFSLGRFYREIAVGSGMGLRFDFSFLLVRFDFATKLYDPGRRPADRWAAANLFGPRSVLAPGQSTLNFGIGYPF